MDFLCQDLRLSLSVGPAWKDNPRGDGCEEAGTECAAAHTAHGHGEELDLVDVA